VVLALVVVKAMSSGILLPRVIVLPLSPIVVALAIIVVSASSYASAVTAVAGAKAVGATGSTGTAPVLSAILTIIEGLV